MNKYRIDKDTILIDTGRIIMYNYPPDARTTKSYICKIYKQIEKGKIGSKEVEGEPIYLENLSVEQQSLFHILGQCQLALGKYEEYEKI